MLVMTQPFKNTQIATAVKNYVAMLLKNDGTGTNNNTFTDQGLGAVPTPVGTPAQGMFSPFSPNGWGYEFDGASTVSFPAGQFSFGTGVYTVECFFTPASTTGIQSPISFGSATLPGGPTPYICLRFDSNELVFEETSTTGFFWRITVPFKAEIGRTYHIAGVRGTAGLISLYLDGALQGTTTYGSSMQNGYQCSIGGLAYGSSPFGYTFNGVVSNARVVKAAVYTAPFSPPTTKLTAISGTVLLTAQDGLFIDRSANNLLPTQNGLPATVPRSPFAPVAWNAATHGGSMFSDGTTVQALDFPASASYDMTGSWTMECWVYPTNNNDFNILDMSSSSYQATIGLKNQGDGKFFWQTVTGTTVTLGTLNIPSFAWTHLAFSRTGSLGGLRTYVNGRNDKSLTWPNVSTSASGLPFRIGQSSKSGVNGQGYISGLRISAAATYTAGSIAMSTITAPPVAVANTTMLLNFNNAAVVDSVNFVDIATFPGCTLSTDRGYGSVSKSLKFDGTGYATLRGQKIGTSDFTFESWVYPTNAIGQVETFFSGVANGELNISRNASGYLTAGTNGAVITTSNIVIPSTKWTHIAVSKNAGTLKVFVNGTLAGSAASTQSFTFSSIAILGAMGAGTSRTNRYQGYIDDVTMTLGDAKYKETFTLPPSTYAIGTFMEGGYFYGVSVQNGVRYGLIMSPAANAITSGKLKTTSVSDGNLADSLFDGWTNTNNLNDAEHPVYQAVRALNINGYNDWYVPAIHEMEPFYRNGKPSTAANRLSGSQAYINGDEPSINPSSDPAGAVYTLTSPAITTADVFKAGGAQQRVGVMASSTTVQGFPDANYGQWNNDTNVGVISRFSKTYTLTATESVRPIRKFVMP